MLSLMICFLLLPLLLNFVENCKPERPESPMRKQCKSTGICANLHLYDANGKTLGVFKGSQTNILVESVAKVQTVGSGCYTIFEKSNFRSSSICLIGNDRRDGRIPRKEYEHTVVRLVSSQLSPMYCNMQQY